MLPHVLSITPHTSLAAKENLPSCLIWPIYHPFNMLTLFQQSHATVLRPSFLGPVVANRLHRGAPPSRVAHCTHLTPWNDKIYGLRVVVFCSRKRAEQEGNHILRRKSSVMGVGFERQKSSRTVEIYFTQSKNFLSQKRWRKDRMPRSFRRPLITTSQDANERCISEATSIWLLGLTK